MKFDIGIIDPPWNYTDKQNNDPKRAGFTYPPLTRNHLASLPLYHVFHDNAILFVWVTSPQLVGDQDGISVSSLIRQWGFEPATIAFSWLKTNKDGSDYSGTGRYTNSNMEHVIIARRGKMLPRVQKNVKQIIRAPISKHSEKPYELYRRIEQLYGVDHQFIEFFARKQNPPPDYYTATGLDYDGVLIQDYLSHFIPQRGC
jgi:N6-adenosine-specific RNA methylase IME4